MERKWTAMDPAKAFFPVALMPVFIEAPEGAGDLFNASSYQALPRHQAVVDSQSGHVFAVVTEDYHLVTNQQAYELAADALKSVLDFTSLQDMECLNVTMPKSRSFCHIDLIHKGSDFEPWQGDRWVPFVRITNSYNRTRRLRFEIGFCRWICLNGIIFGSKSVEISFAHTKQLQDGMRRWQENLGDIKALEKLFVGKLRNLQRFHLPARWMLPLACKVFDVRLPSDTPIKPRRADELRQFRQAIADLSSDYFVKMGEQGYAVLNVLTDYASRPVGVISPETMMDGFQHKAGDWINDFVEQIEQRDFTFETYLGDYHATAEAIAKL
ncbi:Domain of uncharacterised function (DUF932) [Pseudomonas fluorescens]|uniref:Domain of uncharacterized function (DUF932) n=1 Tax=Pseudomonas fluorescens TaxID=294 RepID=A0A379IG64_PSEFL|nr:DUF932 domain-containing protein [Pseudomonas fluorescens]SUD31792.1 Domain of uncharacterised function (DUF932) [Pseudomonas fluorescens]